MVTPFEEKKKPPFMLTVLQFTLIVAAIVVVTGVILGWRSRLEISNGFFWAAAICAAVALGSSMAFSGAVIHSVYHKQGKEEKLMDNVRQDFKKTRPTRRFALQMLVTAAFCFILSVLVGW